MAFVRRHRARNDRVAAEPGAEGDRLARPLRHASIVDVRIRGFFPSKRIQDSAPAWLTAATEVAARAGVITEFEVRVWRDAFHEQEAQGPIVAGRLHMFVWGASRMRRSAPARHRPHSRPKTGEKKTHNEPLQPTGFAGG